MLISRTLSIITVKSIIWCRCPHHWICPMFHVQAKAIWFWWIRQSWSNTGFIITRQSAKRMPQPERFRFQLGSSGCSHNKQVWQCIFQEPNEQFGASWVWSSSHEWQYDCCTGVKLQQESISFLQGVRRINGKADQYRCANRTKWRDQKEL